MAIMTEEQIRRRLDLYLEAEEKVLSGQSYRIGDRELKRADLSKIREAISELTAEVETAKQNGAGCVKRVIF
ncbi:MAG: hypothetical protein IJK81_00480 [Selenomonadaceae bacterium]|nr:hypothetical protein [Selenomonadaceae bacterium]